MNKKYELTSETKTLPDGRVLYRIRSLVNTVYTKAGELGGFIESESNLSTNDISWVANEAMVYGNAKILHDALVSDHAIVCDNAVVWLFAKVSGHAVISDFARVGGYSDISGHSSLNYFSVANNTKMYDFNTVAESGTKDQLYSHEHMRIEYLEKKERKSSFIKDLLCYSLAGLFCGLSLGLFRFLFN